MVSKGPPACHRKAGEDFAVTNRCILLTSSHEDMVDRRVATWSLEGVGTIVLSHGGPAQFSKLSCILRLRDTMTQFRIEVPSYDCHIPADWSELCPGVSTQRLDYQVAGT